MSIFAAFLLLCFLCVGCVGDCHDGAAATDFERVAGDAVQAMQRRAVEMSAVGAGMVAYVPGDATTGWSSRMVVVGRFIMDDTHLLAVVYTKAAVEVLMRSCDAKPVGKLALNWSLDTTISRREC